MNPNKHVRPEPENRRPPQIECAAMNSVNPIERMRPEATAHLNPMKGMRPQAMADQKPITSVRRTTSKEETL